MSPPTRRAQDAELIKQAYSRAADALSEVGRLLRTTVVKHYFWSSSHKTAVSGLIVIIKKLRDDVYDYKDDINETT